MLKLCCRLFKFCTFNRGNQLKTSRLYKTLKIYVLMLLLSGPLLAQQYHLPKGQDSDRIKFELINNLIILPLQINGTELTFILDSGVSKPILFNITQSDSIAINNVSEVRSEERRGGKEWGRRWP